MPALPHSSHDRKLAAALTIGAAFLWSGGGLGVKYIDSTPLSIAGYRALFALPVMLLDVVVRARQARVSPASALVRPRVWAAAASYALMVVTFVAAAKMTTAANAILIQYSGPIYVGLLSWPLLQERMRRVDWIAVLGAAVGLVVFFSTEVSSQGQVGNLVAVLSSFGFAGLPLLLRLDSRALVAEGKPQSVAMMPVAAMALGNALAVLIGLPQMLSHPPPTPQAWLAVVLLGVFQIGVPYILYGIAVRKLRAVESSLLATVEPIISPLWVFLAYGERPGVSAFLGGALIIVSVVLPSALSKSRPGAA